MMTSTLVRMSASMTCIFGLAYALGPSMGLTPALTVGSASGMMGVVPQLLPAQRRREAMARSGAAFVGVVTACVVMTALHGVHILQLALFVTLLSLPVIASRFHTTLGGAWVQGMIGSALMTLLTGRYVTDHWGLCRANLALSALTMALVCFVVTGLVRRPPEVLRQARKSLIEVHEGIAAQMARTLAAPTQRARARLRRWVRRGHRCAVAVEAAMDQTRGFPQGVGDALHHAAYDTDLTLARLATHVEALALEDHRGLDPLRRRVGEICELLSRRDGASVVLATELVGGLTRVIANARLPEDVAARVVTIPALLGELVSEIADGGVAGAATETWLGEHPGVARRARWGAWVPASAGLHMLADAERKGEPDFTTGVTYSDLGLGGDVGAATRAAGTLTLGALALGLAERQALQTFVAVAAASAVGWLMAGAHFFWASFGAFVVLLGTTTTSSRLRKTLSRVVGTVLGALAGLVLAYLTGAGHPLVSLASVIVLAAVAFTLVKRHYGLFSLLLTATVMQIYVLTAQPLVSYALLRVAENLVGAVIAGVVAALVLPLHTSTVVRTVLASLADELIATIAAAEAALAGKAGERPRVAARAVEAAGDNVRRLAASMLGPFAGTSGSWVRAVASRVPAVTSAASDLARLAGELADAHVTRAGAGDVDAADYQALSAQVRRRAAGLAHIHPEPGDEVDAQYVADLTRQLAEVLRWREDLGDPDAPTVRAMVRVLVALDAAVASLVRAAWER